MPEILFIPDLATVLRLSESGTRRAVRRGDCGPYIVLGRRLAVLRESFLTHLLRQQAVAAIGRLDPH